MTKLRRTIVNCLCFASVFFGFTSNSWSLLKRNEQYLPKILITPDPETPNRRGIGGFGSAIPRDLGGREAYGADRNRIYNRSNDLLIPNQSVSEENLKHVDLSNIPVEELPPYEISGSSFAELRDQIAKLGPKADNTKAYAITTLKFNEPNASSLFTEAGVRVKAVFFSEVRIQQQFPKWKDFDKAPKCMQEQWLSFMQILRQHEDLHARANRNYLNMLETHILLVDPQKDVPALIEAINKINSKFWTDLENEHKSIDFLENINPTGYLHTCQAQ